MINNKKPQQPSRRNFVKSAAIGAGGLLVGFHLPIRQGPAFAATIADNTTPLMANTFILLSHSNQVTVLVNHAEMGNGCYTTLPMMVAEELDLDWRQVNVEAAPTLPQYFHSWWNLYLTAGSSSTPSSWQPFRIAGARTRAMMLDAAAKHWQINRTSLSTENGYVIHANKRDMISYGELIDTIKQHNITPPEKVELKKPANFKILGTDVKRLEGPAKVDGSAVFGIDIKQPNLHYASIARPPVYGGKVKSFDSQAAEKIKGVVKIKPVSNGIAVIAKDYWSARKGRDALTISWDDGDNANYSSEQLLAQYRELCKQPGLVAENIGDVETALKNSAQTLEAVYELPLLAHATMEPLNCTARVDRNGCEIWTGTQFQSRDSELVAALLGISQQQVTIHRTLMGGGFGRRASLDADFIIEAVEAARNENFPVKVIWSREEDIQNSGYYRPIFVHRLKGGLDKNGRPNAWHQRLAGQSIMQDTMFESRYMLDGIDVYSVDGCVKQPYAIPNRRVETHNPPKVGYMPLWWRSVGQTHTGFAYECFFDELAHAGGQDPLALRRALCTDDKRMSDVLALIAEKSDWKNTLAENQGRGLAARNAFGSYLAQVVDVTLLDNNTFKVDKITCVIDCGFAVNPLGVKAQIEGGIVYGLTAAAFGEIEMEQGKIKQTNFHNYAMMRMPQMPNIDVHIIKSSETPTGVGEPGTAPIAPAVVNAIFNATGKRIRRLPIIKHGLTMV